MLLFAFLKALRFCSFSIVGTLAIIGLIWVFMLGLFSINRSLLVCIILLLMLAVTTSSYYLEDKIRSKSI
jgi:hypothetical protein